MFATGIEVTHGICTGDFGKEVVPYEILVMWIVHLMGYIAGNGDQNGKLSSFVNFVL